MVYEFRPLFQVLLSHGYYESGFVEDMLIEPSSSAVRKMGGQNFFFRNKPGGFLVLARIHKGLDGSSAAVSVSGEISLAFYLRVQSDVFYKVTQIPTQKGMVLYANNLKESGGGLTTGDWQVLPCKSSSWSYDLTTSVREAGFGFGSLLRPLEAGGGILVSSYCLKRPNGEVALESLEAAVLRQIDLDLSGLSEGCYLLEVNLENNQTLPVYRFVYSEAMDWTPTLGMYEWFAQSKPGTSNDLISMEQSHELSFEDVQSYWRYHIVPAENRKPGSLNLVCDRVNGVDATFGAGLPAETPAGNNTICFTSNQQIPLRQSPTGEVSLQQGSSADPIPLPYAAPGYVMEKKSDKLKVFSEIYVYL